MGLIVSPTYTKDSDEADALELNHAYVPKPVRHL